MQLTALPTRIVPHIAGTPSLQALTTQISRVANLGLHGLRTFGSVLSTYSTSLSKLISSISPTTLIGGALTLLILGILLYRNRTQKPAQPITHFAGRTAHSNSQMSGTSGTNSSASHQSGAGGAGSHVSHHSVVDGAASHVSHHSVVGGAASHVSHHSGAGGAGSHVSHHSGAGGSASIATPPLPPSPTFGNTSPIAQAGTGVAGTAPASRIEQYHAAPSSRNSVDNDDAATDDGFETASEGEDGDITFKGQPGHGAGGDETGTTVLGGNITRGTAAVQERSVTEEDDLEITFRGQPGHGAGGDETGTTVLGGNITRGTPAVQERSVTEEDDLEITFRGQLGHGDGGGDSVATDVALNVTGTTRATILDTSVLPIINESGGDGGVAAVARISGAAEASVVVDAGGVELDPNTQTVLKVATEIGKIISPEDAAVLGTFIGQELKFGNLTATEINERVDAKQPLFSRRLAKKLTDKPRDFNVGIAVCHTDRTAYPATAEEGKKVAFIIKIKPANNTRGAGARALMTAAQEPLTAKIIAAGYEAPVIVSDKAIPVMERMVDLKLFA